jgi:hypothetical protein
MLTRIVIAAVLVLALMVGIKDGRVLKHAGLGGSCHFVQNAADGGEWNACSKGRLLGRPDLTSKSCTSTGIRDKLEYWRCPAPVSSQASG